MKLLSVKVELTF